MFTWLVNAGYLRGNPMALLRQRAKRSAARVTRYLSSSLWDEVKLFVEQLPQDIDAQRAYYARCRWLTTLFYLQGMRISEVAGGQMGQFFRRLGADGHHVHRHQLLTGGTDRMHGSERHVHGQIQR